ncbi:MAG: LamG-like jellyroll fold domain-containing protein, partial [Phycisphaeraceae bacterium JB051]
MVLVLVALSMATVIGLSFLNSQTTTNGIARNVSSQTRARGIAESAMEITIDHLRTSDTWRTELADGTWVGPESVNNQLDGGTFTIIVNDGRLDASGNLTDNDGNLSDEPTDRVVVTATGFYQGVSHTIRAEVTPEAGDATPIRVVIVVSNELLPNAQETARRAQLMDWGYEVTFVSASSSQSRFDELAQQTDVFLVSETISSSQLNHKLRNSGCGVVNEERALYDDFELTAGQANGYSDTRVQLTNTSHYITATLSGQIINVFGQSQNMQYVSEASLPAGAQVLATNPNNDEPALIVVEAGSALQEGSAAGRRVFLPWSTNNLNFNALDTDGLTILKRSIEWASQRSSTPSPVLHYDFSEQSGEVIRDKYGNVDMQFDRGEDDDAITWVTDPNGMGVQFSQDPEEGTAVCITSSPTDCEDLVEHIVQNGAITVQVFFKQLNGTSNGGYILSMANMAVEEDTDPVQEDGGRGRHGRGHHGSRHGHGHHGGHHSLNTQATYSESVDITNDPDTYIFYSHGGGQSSSNGQCGWSRRSSSRSDSYRVCYSRDRGYYYRRCGNGDDDDDQDEVPEDAPDLYDNFTIDGTPNASAFNHGLYLSHSDNDVSMNVTQAWQEDTAIVYAFTFDSSTGIVSIYVNGQLIDTEQTDETDMTSWVSQWLTLGNSPSLSRPFVGTIYDVKIWPQALSASQLQDTADTLLGDDSEGQTPNIIVLYEFDEVAPVAPQLISQWKLNETTGLSSGSAMYGTGVSAGEKFEFKGSADIDGFRSSNGNYGGSNRFLPVTATINSTSGDRFEIKDGGTKLYGNALCGAWGSPNHVIDVSGSAV